MRCGLHDIWLPRKPLFGLVPRRTVCCWSRAAFAPARAIGFFSTCAVWSAPFQHRFVFLYPSKFSLASFIKYFSHNVLQFRTIVTFNQDGCRKALGSLKLQGNINEHAKDYLSIFGRKVCGDLVNAREHCFAKF